LKKTSTKPFSAKVTLGLEKGYTGNLIEKSLVIKFIQNYQDHLIKDKNIMLSVSLSECTIILSGQEEPHLNLNFINYPKFPLEETVLKSEIENMTKSLMSEFQQNRVIIEYLDETVMLEKSFETDPRIKLNFSSR
jgi:Flp pilus assembly secretin CpaC